MAGDYSEFILYNNIEVTEPPCTFGLTIEELEDIANGKHQIQLFAFAYIFSELFAYQQKKKLWPIWHNIIYLFHSRFNEHKELLAERVLSHSGTILKPF